jgi:ribosomal protein S18 acetylase RimI-like enzyme
VARGLPAVGAVTENAEPYRVRELDDADVQPLLEASEAEGFNFVRRVVAEWRAGQQRFEATGEALLGCRADGRLVALCGLMRDPYLDDSAVGRLRNLYVLPEYRGRGLGALLTRRVLELAPAAFRLLRLRAVDARAARLYERLGFQSVAELAHCTHVLPLRGEKVDSDRGASPRQAATPAVEP